MGGAEAQAAGGQLGATDLQIMFVVEAGAQQQQRGGELGAEAPPPGGGGAQPGGGGAQPGAGGAQPGGAGGAGDAARMPAQQGSAPITVSAASATDGVGSFVLPMTGGANTLRIAAMRGDKAVQLQPVAQQGGVHVFIVRQGGTGGAAQQPGAGGAGSGASMSGQGADAIVLVYLGQAQAPAGAQPAGAGGAGNAGEPGTR
jgi:hypothetical protein